MLSALRNFVIICLLLLCGSLSAADSLRIATYNLRNYLVMDRHVDGVWHPSYPKPEIEKEAMREVILDARPDILIIQEVGGPAFLDELRADLALFDLHYPYMAHMRGQDEVRHVAVLSKLKPEEVVRHVDLDFKYFDQRKQVKRGLLEVSFQFGDEGIFKVFGLHLKSRYTSDKRDPESEKYRTLEAEACRNRIVERTKDAGLKHYMVAGDFNAHPRSAPMRRFYKRGDLDLGELLPVKDSRGEVWTYYYAKYATYSQIDGFVFSPALLPHVLDESGHIVDIQEALFGSDHRLVYLDLVEPR